MFYDQAKIYVKGGDGGNGVVAFRREKYVPEGGPNGGDGGKGGNVVFQADEGLRTLVDFRYQRHYKAARGEHGGGKNMHGKNAEDLIVRVPVGTVVKDAETGEFLADFTQHGQTAVIARGGRGGRGNARFATAQNKAPAFAEKGEPGEERWVELELKVLADVGLIGFPNVGKSTLISVVSAAKPKIADYHFTTLVPNLGVVIVDEGKSFVMADIPGLIEGAHAGAGLGHDFLRHTERTRVLVHVLDISGSEGRDPIEDYKTINHELQLYNEELAQRIQVIAANKMDLPGAEENLARLQGYLGDKHEIFPMSAAVAEGVKPLVYRLAELLDELTDAPTQVEHLKVTKVSEAPRFTVRYEDGVYVVEGREVEKHFAMTDFENEEAVKRFQQIMRRMGVEDELRKRGIKDGDVVRIKDLEFEYVI
ncbi:GTP-binding protein Obg/CgtA [Thermincola ferriacetica]|uniref:GTPase Obg n=1 Tax=Thermincola ferriacetica TaxID=281456 RepID=A0A0L6W1X8_9FIRM|nr:GTPase ObgE [Thermincola ferriacetica]KNZ69540.1 GTP-binding protein Obg/CgtA [Thermincola ferriacetica]